MHLSRLTSIVSFVFVLGGLICAPALAQKSSEGYAHTYARPGQKTETIYIWGAVDNPGIWEIAPDTDLVELFSVARPSGFAQERPERETEIRFRIHRVQNGEMKVAHEMELEELLEMPLSQRPSLQAEDVIEVRAIETRKFGFGLISTIVGTASSVTLLIIRFANF